MLIVIEGISGAGKTTLLKALEKRFENIVFVDEFAPDYLDGYIQKLIQSDPYLRLSSSEQTPIAQAMTLMGALAYKYETQIKPALEQGKIVVVDRYKDTILAYQPETAAMQGMTDKKKTQQWLQNSLEHLPEPDITIYLDLDQNMVGKRLIERGDKSVDEVSDFREKIMENYKELSASKGANTISLNVAEGSVDQQADKIVDLVRERLAALRNIKKTANKNFQNPKL